MKQLLTVALLFIFVACHAQPQLSLKQAEEAFLNNNLELVAGALDINIAQARILQAGIWENPYFSAEINAIHPAGRSAASGNETKFFDAGRQGQKVLAVQQLVYMGGKKKNEIALARTNAHLAELAFKDLLRNLKYQLRTTYFNLYYSKQSADVLDRQLHHLDTLIGAYKAQVSKGNTPLKDLVRLQSLYIDLKNSQAQLLNRIADEQADLGILTALDGAIQPVPSSEELARYQKTYTATLPQIESAAIDNRPDIAFAERRTTAARQNLNLQRSLSRPDLTLGANYDQRGGAFENQVNLTLGIPLRLRNINKGNINAAGLEVRQTDVNRELTLIQLKQEISAAVTRYYTAMATYNAVTANVEYDFNEVYNGVLYNFQRRNISLIEFTDFMESYNQSIIQLNDARLALVEASEQLNKVAGTDMIN